MPTARALLIATLFAACTAEPDPVTGLVGDENSRWDRSFSATCVPNPGACDFPDCECDNGLVFVCSGENCGCRPPCSTDADCALDSACLCESVPFRPKQYFGNITHGLHELGICAAAECRTAEDCDGRACGVDPSGLHCRTERDTCSATSNCLGQSDLCMFNGDHWACTPFTPQ